MRSYGLLFYSVAIASPGCNSRNLQDQIKSEIASIADCSTSAGGCAASIVRMRSGSRIGERPVGVRGPVEEVALLVFETIRGAAAGLRAGPPGSRVDHEQQRAIGSQSLDRELVDVADRIDTEPTAAALVGER